MKSFLATLLLLVLVACTQAFTVQPLAASKNVVASRSPTELNMVFGKRKTKAQQEEENAKFWQGDWVCKDCGYIYQKVRTYSLIHVPSCSWAVLQRAFDKRIDC